MTDSEEQKIKLELENIFGNIDRIIKRIDTEDPVQTNPDDHQTHPGNDSGQSPPPPPTASAD